jgi:hypothetical protein
MILDAQDSDVRGDGGASTRQLYRRAGEKQYFHIFVASSLTPVA